MMQQRIMRLAAAAAGGAAASLALRAQAQGEELGGVLTGRFDIANTAGAVWLCGSAVLAIALPRHSFLPAVIGAVLIAPMQTWRLAPGLWCTLSNCSGDHPAVVGNPASAAALALAALSVALNRRVRTL